jgi:hypothetical protein
MPSVKQTTVDPAASTRGMGSSDTESLSEAFPASPIHAGDVTRNSLEGQFNDLALQGVVKNGLGIASYDRDFTGADSGVAFPNGDVATGAGGLPASQYVPNPASPGPGSQNPTDLPAPPEGFGETPNGDTYGSGTGALTRPSDTSKTIARHTLGSYGLGTSEPTK